MWVCVVEMQVCVAVSTGVYMLVCGGETRSMRQYFIVLLMSFCPCSALLWNGLDFFFFSCVSLSCPRHEIISWLFLPYCVCYYVAICAYEWVDVLFCHWGMLDIVSDLEVDIYRFMVSCMKGHRGETERFTLSLSVYVSAVSPLVAQGGQCMTDILCPVWPHCFWVTLCSWSRMHWESLYKSRGQNWRGLLMNKWGERWKQRSTSF